MQVDISDQRLDSIIERRNLLRHPFYEAWVAGTLTRAELRAYAIQYGHVVAAIPGWLRSTAALYPGAREKLMAHAREESDHIGLWHGFASALGISASQIAETPPNAATARLLGACTTAAESGNGAAIVWALEAQAPAVSAEKLRGLAAHYDIHAGSGAQYFALHAELDKEHERELRDFMKAQALAGARASVDAADETTQQLWDLLTSVQAHD